MRRIVGNGAIGDHNLGPGVLQNVEVFGSNLVGRAHVKMGGTVIGTYAAGAVVGARPTPGPGSFPAGGSLPISAPLIIWIENAADNLAVDFAGTKG